MAKYLVQKFLYGKGDTVFFAQQDEHNHDKSNEFSKEAIKWLIKNAKWPKDDIEIGKFKSSQSNHPAGKELAWDGKKWKKV